jgi:hypothetical protein
MSDPRKERTTPRERPANGPDINQSVKQVDRKTDQGIVRDERGQDQPSNKEQAQRG